MTTHIDLIHTKQFLPWPATETSVSEGSMKVEKPEKQMKHFYWFCLCFYIFSLIFRLHFVKMFWWCSVFVCLFIHLIRWIDILDMCVLFPSIIGISNSLRSISTHDLVYLNIFTTTNVVYLVFSWHRDLTLDARQI